MENLTNDGRESITMNSLPDTPLSQEPLVARLRTLGLGGNSQGSRLLSVGRWVDETPMEPLGHDHSPENESHGHSAHETEGQPAPFPGQPPDTAGPGNIYTSAFAREYVPYFGYIYLKGHPRHKELYEENPFAVCNTLCYHDLPTVECIICFPLPRCLHHWPLIRCHHCRNCITCSGAVSGTPLRYNGTRAVCTSDNPPWQEIVVRDTQRLVESTGLARNV